jgi:hypothetical protein
MGMDANVTAVAGTSAMLDTLYSTAPGKNPHQVTSTTDENRRGAIDYLLSFGVDGCGDSLFKTARVDKTAFFVGKHAPFALPDKYINHWPVVARFLQ